MSEPGGGRPLRLRASLEGSDRKPVLVLGNLRPVLGSITSPTLLIAASEDPSTPPPHGALIARGIAGARLRVIRGAAHLANVQTPGEFTAALLDHLLASAS